MSATTINIDDNTKKEAQELLKDMGMNLSTAVFSLGFEIQIIFLRKIATINLICINFSKGAKNTF